MSRDEYVPNTDLFVTGDFHIGDAGLAHGIDQTGCCLSEAMRDLLNERLADAGCESTGDDLFVGCIRGDVDR